MSNIAIRVENLGKKYRIGRRESYQALRDVLTDTVVSPFRQLRRLVTRQQNGTGRAEETIWALKALSCTINHGEVIGVIGRNGAGKSTLLKILSRITEPSEGFAEIHGRVGSLLEVGTGFHPELTGRENVYLNGAILGMHKTEIDRKFDEIVAFAEVERFLDTALKHYSSGMQTRLAFAVAAHLDPEILIVDEVLAVGDARFQRRCLKKMQDVSSQGRTVLFVSHNMATIARLCRRTILLNEGTLLRDGPSTEVVREYLNSDIGTSAARAWPDVTAAPGNEVVRLRGVRVRSEGVGITDTVDIRRRTAIDVEFDVLLPGHVLFPTLSFTNEDDVCAFISLDRDPEWLRRPRIPGRYISTAWIPGNFMAEGTFRVGVAVVTEAPFHEHVAEHNAVAFLVVDSLDGDSVRGDAGGRLPGVVRPNLTWDTDFVAASTEQVEQLTR